MKKIIPFILLVFLALSISLVPIFLVPAKVDTYLPEQDTGYEITAYDIKMNVEEDGAFVIEEKLNVHFYTSGSHGIYRWLPTIQTSTYKNKKGEVVSKNFRASVSKVKYNNSLSTVGTNIVKKFEEEGNYFMVMGSEYYTIPADSDREYAFSYKYNYSSDRDTSMDMLYYNIVGTGWDTRISNLTFEINLPKAIEKEGMEFYVGKYGESSENSSRVTFDLSEDGKIISGSVNRLEYGEAVTIFKSLNEGYFDYKTDYMFDFALLLLIAVIVVFAGFLYLTKKSKSPIVEVVEFKAPEGLTSAEVGLINDGKLTGDDLSSLIIYWASKGFVQIKEEDKQTKILRVVTNEEIAGKMKKHEEILFKDMFRNDRNLINAKDLNLNIETGLKCSESVKSETKKYFDNSAGNLYNGLIFLSVILLGAFAFKNIWQSVLVNETLFIQIVFAILPALWLIGTPTLFKYKDKCKKHVFKISFGLLCFSIFVPLISQMFFVEAFCDPFYIRVINIFVLAIVVMIYPYLERYTKEGKDILGRIRGLKNYILVAEKDRMEMLVHDNPKLFYEVLPYAYVLGVSDVYMKKFENVEIVQPSSEPSLLDTYCSFRVLNHCMRVTSLSVEQNIAKGIAQRTNKMAGNISSHFGGSGGGGFSGGGHGGGGGGRW